MKKWYEQIHSQGVLCKHIWDGEIVKAVSYEDENDLILTDKTDFDGDKDKFVPSDLTPLTAAEIWQFMPWKPIETAPIDESVFISNKIDKFLIGSLCADGRVISAAGNYMFNINGCYWLPLPDGDL